MMDKAIYTLYPNVVRVVNGVEAFDAQGNQVTIDMDAVNAWTDPDQYKYDRAAAYPSLPDQLDQIYHEGVDAWKATIAAVKMQYPKPE